MSRICCARCLASFTLSQDEVQNKLAICPSCGNLIQLWLTPETDLFHSSVTKEAVNSDRRTFQFTEQDVIDLFIWTEVNRYLNSWNCGTLEQAIWEWADGNIRDSDFDNLEEVKRLMEVAKASYARAKKLATLAELIRWNAEECRASQSLPVDAPVVKIPFGRSEHYATLKKKSISTVHPSSTYESQGLDPLDVYYVDAYGFQVDGDGRAFMPGYGWMDADEADAQRRFMDAEDGIPWDD